jgi:glutamine synthetase
VPSAASPPTCDLVALVVCDLGSIVRGPSMRSSELDRQPQATVGWVPSIHVRPPFGPSISADPFGSIGDLRLKPDGDTRVVIAADEASSALEFVLCDMVELDGDPWECCPRTFLRGALQELERELGAHVLASFEHEFQLLLDAPPGPPFSLDAQRRVDPFPARVMGALIEAGVQPERFIAECSAHQFEIPLAAAEGLASADRSVTLREVVREVARRQGARASFAPLLGPAEQGNGLHIHLRLVDADGTPLLYDPGRPACLSELGGSFASGILAHTSALTALTAPSPVSCTRLQLNRRSASAVCLGQRNREALLRIPPLSALAEGDLATQLRLEYRGADATANPYLALGALVRAGLAGVREELRPPPILDRDPTQLGAEEAERYGVGALPSTLDESLRALADDATVRGWVPPLLYDVYVSVKRAEADAAADQDLEEVCRRYAAIY